MAATSGATDLAANDDVVIVGAGLAGLFCALKMAPRPVTLIADCRLGETADHARAQGGIAAAVAAGDSVEAHAADTIAAGAGIGESRIAQLMAADGPARIEDLARLGVPFDRDGSGDLLLSLEAGHRERRIARVGGDLAGREIMAALVAAVRATPSIRLIEGYSAEDLIREGSRVTGLIAIANADDGGPPEIRLSARAVVIASGGIGGLYAMSTNAPQTRGQGLAAAARAGALVADTEFVQFHPTAIATDDDPVPLATEALRGEGAHLVNAAGERFMTPLHADGELAGRDLAARAVLAEIEARHGAFLDCRPVATANLAETFPLLARSCATLGIDPARQPVPIAPAVHFHMGGVLTDACGRTSVDGLWACGEVASTGAHGANRLGGNAMLEAVVFAARAAADIRAIYPAAQPMPPPDVVSDAEGPGLFLEGAAIDRLRQTMSLHVGLVRNHEGLTAALREIAELERQGGASHGFRNMVTAARLITVAALGRAESRGSHFRADFPEADPAHARRRIGTLREAENQARAAIAPQPERACA